MVTDQGWPEKPLPNPACPGQDANDLPARVDDRLAEIAEAPDLKNRSLRRRRYRDDISPPAAEPSLTESEGRRQRRRESTI